MGGIPLTVVGSSAMPHQEGLAATSEAGMILPQTVWLSGGDTVSFVGPPLGYPAMLPLGMQEGTAPLQPAPPLSRTPSLKEAEEQGGEGRQTRIARFQVTKVAEEVVRRGGCHVTIFSPVYVKDLSVHILILCKLSHSDWNAAHLNIIKLQIISHTSHFLYTGFHPDS